MRNKMLYILLMIWACWGGGALANDVALLPEVNGVLGMDPVGDSSYFAVWIDVPDKMALSSLQWYNNDSAVVFPEILIASGSEDGPVQASDCLPVGQDVVGASSGWSTFTLPAPVASTAGGFYVLFRLPQGSVRAGLGYGGGAGFGFSATGGCTGWMSVDGIDWVRIGRSFRFSAMPGFVAAEGWMYDKAMAGLGGQDVETDEEAIQLVTGLLSPFPNPFNPVTEIHFTLKSESHVSLDVYDIKGRRVANLKNETLGRGAHTLCWYGFDGAGQRVSSGMYFVRMKTGSQVFTRRVTMIK